MPSFTIERLVDGVPYFRTREELGDISGIFYIPKPSPPLPKPPPYKWWHDALLGCIAGALITLTWWLTR